MSVASVNYNITNGVPPFNFSVKDSNGTEQFINYVGDKINFNAPTNGVYVVKVTKDNCVVSNQITVINCASSPVVFNPPTTPPVSPPITIIVPMPPTSSPVACVGISNLNIVGLNNVSANSNVQYTMSYTGLKPLTYSWQISGQGSQIISGSNTDTVNVKFGSSGNYFLYLIITDNCGTTISAAKELALIPVIACDIAISNIVIDCVANNSNTVTVSANSPSGKTLVYGIKDVKNYQSSNVFNLVNSDINGYTFLVAEFGNESACVESSNRMVTCIKLPPVSAPIVVPSSPPIALPPVAPLVCDIIISGLGIKCNSTTSVTVVVSASSISGRTLQYGILGFKTYQSSNTFNLGNSDNNGYTFIVSEVNNESCNNTMNRVINCSVATAPTVIPTSPPVVVPVAVPTTPPVANCDISINNIVTQCNSSTSSTTVVNASSLSGKTLRYGILGLADYQTSNTFNLGNSDANGYTFIVAELNNITCNARTNRVINCNLPPTSPPVVTPVTVPIATPVAAPVSPPVNPPVTAPITAPVASPVTPVNCYNYTITNNAQTSIRADYVGCDGIARFQNIVGVGSSPRFCAKQYSIVITVQPTDVSNYIINPYEICTSASPVVTPVVAPVSAPVVTIPPFTPLPPFTTPTSLVVNSSTPTVAPITTPIPVPVAVPVAPPVSPPVAAPVQTPIAIPIAVPIAAPVSPPVTAPVVRVPISIAPAGTNNTVGYLMDCSTKIITVSGNFASAGNFGISLINSANVTLLSLDNIPPGAFNKTFANVGNDSYKLKIFEIGHDINTIFSTVFTISC